MTQRYFKDSKTGYVISIPISFEEYMPVALTEADFNGKHTEPDPEVKALRDCLEGAVKDFDRDIQEAYKKAGGMFSWFGPEWYEKAVKILRPHKPWTPPTEKI